MNVGTQHYRCSRCGLVKERTGEHFYFRSDGNVTGYCRTCQRAWGRAYWGAVLPYQRARHNAASRDYWRRSRGTDPARYRVRDGEIAS